MHSEVTKGNKNTGKIRNVLLAAPSYDGKVSVWHATSLAETCKLGLSRGINIVPVYVSYDALVQRARNDIFRIAVESGVDDLFFVDCDIDWNPEDFFRLLAYDVDIIGAPVIKKNDIEQYSIKTSLPLEKEENGLVSVESVATGFMRIRRDALLRIWENCTEVYQETQHKTQSKMIFQIKVIGGSLYSEDVNFCLEWRYGGGKIYIDPVINCGHEGNKRWVGNFSGWVNKLVTDK